MILWSLCVVRTLAVWKSLQIEMVGWRSKWFQTQNEIAGVSFLILLVGPGSAIESDR